MRSDFLHAFRNPRAGALRYAFAFGLFACVPAHAQNAATHAVTPIALQATIEAHDPLHDAAILRLVKAFGFDKIFAEILSSQFKTPGPAGDPEFDRFVNQVFPPWWTDKLIVDLIKPGAVDISTKDLDAATRFFHTPTGKKISALSIQVGMEGKSGNELLEKLTPGERAETNQFAATPAGLAFTRMSNSLPQNSRVIGRQAGEARMKELLAKAQTLIAPLSENDLQLEMNRLHDGKSNANTFDQLALIAEFGERAARHQVTEFATIKPIMLHLYAMEPNEMISAEGIAQFRKEMNAADDAFTGANDELLKLNQFMTECTAALSAPQQIKKNWQATFTSAFDASSRKVNTLTISVHEYTQATRTLLDFTEGHAARTTLTPDGKLQFASNEDTEGFRSLARDVDQARAKVQGAADALKRD